MRQVDAPNNEFMMWGRMRDQPLSRAALGFMADFVPVSVARSAGLPGAGISLDNSMRFVQLVETDWVLDDFDPLLGYASQTAAGFIQVNHA